MKSKGKELRGIPATLAAVADSLRPTNKMHQMQIAMSLCYWACAVHSPGLLLRNVKLPYLRKLLFGTDAQIDYGDPSNSGSVWRDL